jgi:hypothetical protein
MLHHITASITAHVDNVPALIVAQYTHTGFQAMSCIVTLGSQLLYIPLTAQD